MNHDEQREFMVERQIVARGIRSAHVIRAMNCVPREAFLPGHLSEFAYEDSPLPIAENQTISQPYIVALMIQALNLHGGERVLEIGTGSGYAAAVLAEIAGEVYSIERHNALATQARLALGKQGYDHVKVIRGDGSVGFPEAAPYHGIIVAAGSPEAPEALKQQLAVGGNLVIPVGPETAQSLRQIHRVSADEFVDRSIADVRFVPLIGASGWPGSDSPAIQPESRSKDKPKGRSASASKGQAGQNNSPHGKAIDGPSNRLSSASANARKAFNKDTCQLLKTIADPIDDLDHFDMTNLLNRIGDSRIVLIGEASHGTSEFYRFRSRITQALIEHKNFDFVAIEADWPDAHSIDRYTRHSDQRLVDKQPFTRFPTWMWRNEEVLEFVQWLRHHNGGITQEQKRVGFYGLDMYSLYTSIAAVVDYLDATDPKAAQVARERYGCLTPWQSDPFTYARATLTESYHNCEDAVVLTLTDLLRKQLEYSKADGDRFLDAVQNARLVANAERYYRSLYSSYSTSWNLRDEHMFETLESLMAYHGKHCRAIVWEHNSHIGDASATDMAARGQFNVGQLCRENYGDNAYLIGLGTHSGEVAAASEWGGPMEVKRITPSLPGSWEDLCHQTELKAFSAGLRHTEGSRLYKRLCKRQLERAIGVIYRPETERESHYFNARLANQFDEFIWFDKTHAVTPLRSQPTQTMPDTYPFGL